MVNRCAWSDQRFDCYIFLVAIWNLHSICYQRELIIVILFLSKLRSSEVACFKPNVMGGGSSLQFCCRGKVDWRCVTTQSSCVATLPFSLVFRVLRLKGGFVGSNTHKIRGGALSHRMICEPYPVLRLVAADIGRSCRIQTEYRVA